jgi:hypothetical protein
MIIVYIELGFVPFSYKAEKGTQIYLFTALFQTIALHWTLPGRLFKGRAAPLFLQNIQKIDITLLRGSFTVYSTVGWNHLDKIEVEKSGKYWRKKHKLWLFRHNLIGKTQLHQLTSTDAMMALLCFFSL